MRLKYVSQPLDQDLAAGIGQVIYRWTTLEYMISLLIGTVLNAELGGMMIVTNNISVSTQTRWIRALIGVQDTDVEASGLILELLARADELRSERNELVHGIWEVGSSEPKTALVQTVNLERKEIARTRLVTIQDLTDLTVDITEWIQDYIELGTQLGFPRNQGDTKSIFAV